MKRNLLKLTELVKVTLKKMSLVAFLALIFFTGCQKEQLNSTGKIAVMGGSSDWQYPYSFNWEDPNLNNMPYSNNNISLPWIGSGAIANVYGPDVVNDRVHNDGWELVYNLFSPTATMTDPYFILYNKYRGLMRIYFYQNSYLNSAPSTYLQDGILINTPGKLLQFAGKDIVDVLNMPTRFDKAEPVIPSGPPFAINNWFMLQYELAYDPDLTPTTSQNPPIMTFYINSINIDNVNLSGTDIGTLNGTIGSAGNGSSNLISKILGATAPTAGVLAVVGANFISDHTITDEFNTPLPAGSNNLGLANGAFEAISKGISSAISSGVSSIPGAAFNILSAIIGGSSASTQQTVSLNLSTNINLHGNITSQFKVFSADNWLPGSVKANANGQYNVQNYIPLYNLPLGVFNLSNRPTLDETTIIDNDRDDPRLYHRQNEYTVNEGSYQIIFNPAVTSIAAITNITKEIIIYAGGGYLLPPSSMRYESLGFYSNKDIGVTDYTRLSYYNDPTETAYLRISFNVVPKDGSPVSAIIKTFAVNVNRTIIDRTEPIND